ncbi:MAG: hypothetical protein VXW58_02600 [Pseudomonadota bacterium]|nr:hypothetical protein [Pseudomonadota bacterium]
MQFIDQSAAYNRKSITLEKAIATDRARVTAAPGAEALMVAFRPELKLAIAFDLDIDERVTFNDLPTAEKIDLLIDELLPRFFHPDLLLLTGRDIWHVRFVVDGTTRRTIRLDDLGVRDVSHLDPAAEIELETDVMTLLALLRSAIAQFHVLKPPYPDLPPQPEDTEAVEYDSPDVTGS